MEGGIGTLVNDLSGEELSVHPLLRPAGGLTCIKDMIHEAGGAADVEMATLIDCVENCCRIQFLLLRTVVIVQHYAVREGCVSECLDEGCPVAGAKAVMKLEVSVAMGKFIRHGQDRGNADTTCKKEMTRSAMIQFEQVARRTDGQFMALADNRMHCL
ncbi:hypothetical protein PpSQ1_10260 [Pseudomonas putida]|nr:hypothetical protein PpSQ1_10260 [Pseudomonas putida]